MVQTLILLSPLCNTLKGLKQGMRILQMRKRVSRLIMKERVDDITTSSLSPPCPFPCYSSSSSSSSPVSKKLRQKGLQFRLEDFSCREEEENCTPCSRSSAATQVEEKKGGKLLCEDRKSNSTHCLPQYSLK